MIPFTQDIFYRLSYTPYNAVVASFFVAQGKASGMREEQAQEAEHRRRQMRMHHHLGRDWYAFLDWQTKAELSLINQIEELHAQGCLPWSVIEEGMMACALRICALPVEPMGTWQACPRTPRWSVWPERILQVLPVGIESILPPSTQGKPS